MSVSRETAESISLKPWNWYKRKQEGRGREGIIYGRMYYFLSLNHLQVLFCIYKYLKCNNNYANFLETTRYFPGVLSSLYNMNKKKGNPCMPQKCIFTTPAFIVQWKVTLAATFPHPPNENSWTSAGHQAVAYLFFCSSYCWTSSS